MTRLDGPASGHGHGHGTARRTVALEERVLAKNDDLAAANRRLLARLGVLAVNLMSSPGSGKTTLLERTVRELDGSPVAVVEGDQETLLDAERIRATGCPVVQINTGEGCHLDATMLERGLAELDPAPGTLLFVENVGNLVCPALFDLGETARAVVMSVTEGEDKPAKYPHMFRTADVVLLNKIDLLPYVDFDVERCTQQLARLVLGCDHPQRVRITPDGRAQLCFALPRSDVTPADDVRGLGAVLYRLLTTHRPLSSADAARAGLAAAERTPGGALLPPSEHRPGVPVGDYVASGLRRVADTARYALAHRIEDDLPAIGEPVLVVRGGGDAVVPQRWAEQVTAALPDGRLAVLPGRGHALNHSAPGPLAAAIRPFLGGPPPGPDAPTARAATDSIAQFDSATTFLRGTAAALHGRDLPALGVVPRPLAPLVERIVPAVNALPVALREQVYRLGSGSEAAPPGELHAVSAERLARWMVAQYPRREFPAAIVGSSSGALAHLAAAMGVPFLPQTFLLPVAQPQVDPDDPRHGLTAGVGPGRMLLDANPNIALHHMHDPNQDRLSLARMTYFRLKRRRLGPAFTDFLAGALPAGATLLDQPGSRKGS